MPRRKEYRNIVSVLKKRKVDHLPVHIKPRSLIVVHLGLI